MDESIPSIFGELENFNFDGIRNLEDSGAVQQDMSFEPDFEKEFGRSEPKVLKKVIKPPKLKETEVKEIAPPLSPVSKLLLEAKIRKNERLEKDNRNRRQTRSKTKSSNETILVSDSTATTAKVGNKRQSRRIKNKEKNPVIPVQPEPAQPVPAQLQLLDDFLRTNNSFENRAVERNCARWRRNFIAEKAARITSVDYVDLVSCVAPRVEGFISLDSDEETTITQPAKVPTCKTANKKEVLDYSFDEENPEVDIKLKWNGNIKHYKLRKYQKFLHIFEQIAEQEHVDIGNIVLNLNDKFVNPSDSPNSIDYKIYHFISGRVLEQNSTLASSSTFTKATVVKAPKGTQLSLNLKIQADGWKRPIEIDHVKTEIFKILYIKCAEELNLTHDKIKLSFDGEPLEYNASPADLELEGGEIIDLRIIQ